MPGFLFNRFFCKSASTEDINLPCGLKLSQDKGIELAEIERLYLGHFQDTRTVGKPITLAAVRIILGEIYLI